MRGVSILFRFWCFIKQIKVRYEPKFAYDVFTILKMSVNLDKPNKGMATWAGFHNKQTRNWYVFLFENIQKKWKHDFKEKELGAQTLNMKGIFDKFWKWKLRFERCNYALIYYITNIFSLMKKKSKMHDLSILKMFMMSF